MGAIPDLVCVGHIVRELIYFPEGVKGPFLGSPPAYAAVAASRQGASTGVVTRTGPDMPANLLQPLFDAGVDLAGLGKSPTTTVSHLVYDEHGNKEIRYPARADPITAQDVPKSYHGCRLIYICPMDNDVPAEELGAVAALGRIAAADLGGYGGVHMSKANRDQIVPEDLACQVCRHFRIVKASDEDAAAIFGWNNPEAAAERLLACGPRLVVMTAGAKGSLIFSHDGRAVVPAIPVEVVDATGGGDAFMAGFLCEYLRSADPVKSARWGAATAACVIEQTGGVRPDRMPTKQQVQQRLNRHGHC